MVLKKRYYFEAGLSFFVVGLGQLYKGEGEKALWYILFFYFALPISIYLMLLLNAYLFLVVLGISSLTAIIFWLYNVRDALLHHTTG